MIRRYTAATALALGLAATAVVPASAETTAPETGATATASTTNESTNDSANDSSAYPANGGSSSKDSSQPGSAESFFKQIKPADVTSVFGNIVSLVSAILGFVGKVV